jgi:nickel superoxide dismutase
MKIRNIIAISIIIVAFGLNNLHAHCQVPCGIYDDAVRIIQIREHVTTIEKAMKQIDQLTSDESSAQNMNQLVRWINTKEEHATFIQSIISDYFLAQRIKPKQNNEAGRQQYIDQTLLLQQIIVSAMKSKQTVDKSEPELVSTLINQFVQLYFNEHGKEHLNAMQKG